MFFFSRHWYSNFLANKLMELPNCIWKPEHAHLVGLSDSVPVAARYRNIMKYSCAYYAYVFTFNLLGRVVRISEFVFSWDTALGIYGLLLEPPSRRIHAHTHTHTHVIYIYTYIYISLLLLLLLSILLLLLLLLLLVFLWVLVVVVAVVVVVVEGVVVVVVEGVVVVVVVSFFYRHIYICNYTIFLQNHIYII